MISVERWEKFLVQDIVLLVAGGLCFFFAFGLLSFGVCLVLVFTGLGLMGVAAFDVCRLVFFNKVEGEVIVE